VELQVDHQSMIVQTWLRKDLLEQRFLFALN